MFGCSEHETDIVCIRITNIKEKIDLKLQLSGLIAALELLTGLCCDVSTLRFAPLGMNSSFPVVKSEVLEPYVRVFRGPVDEDFIFMDDNARAHASQLVGDFLEKEGIRRIVWPARSPDPNLIEHVCIVSRAIA
ncbi:hypothetical protein AVEN_114996-1 [Araneus ventricosus]|uniref:Tc1-like transposase DDE domain-containing protein n=1 Tax=Araneus ventricosus TaxID=182803 RepID=A0A4Y1ZX30_ARAVE|nr:hypothetical protein AVEN_114996-1 [Araneus ventricosus]